MLAWEYHHWIPTLPSLGLKWRGFCFNRTLPFLLLLLRLDTSATSAVIAYRCDFCGNKWFYPCRFFRFWGWGDLGLQPLNYLIDLSWRKSHRSLRRGWNNTSSETKACTRQKTKHRNERSFFSSGVVGCMGCKKYISLKRDFCQTDT